MHVQPPVGDVREVFAVRRKRNGIATISGKLFIAAKRNTKTRHRFRLDGPRPRTHPPPGGSDTHRGDERRNNRRNWVTCHGARALSARDVGRRVEAVAGRRRRQGDAGRRAVDCHQIGRGVTGHRCLDDALRRRKDGRPPVASRVRKSRHESPVTAARRARPAFAHAIDRCYGEASRCGRRRERAQRSEPRERSEPTKRLARERVGESEGRSPSE